MKRIATNGIYKLFIILLVIMLASCQNGYLGKKPDKSLLVPKTPADFQSLLDNFNVFNVSPGLNVISGDELAIPDELLDGFGNTTEKNCYLWAKDLYGGEQGYEWNLPYQQVFYANIILDGLPAVNSTTPADARNVRGGALFYRAFAYFNLVQDFAKVYDPATAAIDPGVILRLHSDVNDKPGRASVAEVYDQVTKDLTEAEALLPITAAYQSRPVKAAAQALLARVYLQMGQYDKASAWATSALKLHPGLIDYNTLDATADMPFPNSPAVSNAEVILYTRNAAYEYSIAGNTIVSPELYALYEDNDLRKSVFFSGGDANYFKGRYTGSGYDLFGGFATDELYLIRAECSARAGDGASALADLNTLLVARWKKGAYKPYNSANAGNVLSLVLSERRKELACRGLRWEDLKRLNREQGFAKTLVHQHAGQDYRLAPGDPRYVFPIPAQEITISGIAQNER
jgi:tetratricopeptide (TPR) repeat protein